MRTNEDNKQKKFFFWRKRKRKRRRKWFEGDGLERCDTRYAPQRMGRKSTGGNERHVLVWSRSHSVGHPPADDGRKRMVLQLFTGANHLTGEWKLDEQPARNKKLFRQSHPAGKPCVIHNAGGTEEVSQKPARATAMFALRNHHQRNTYLRRASHPRLCQAATFGGTYLESGDERMDTIAYYLSIIY